MTIFVISDTHFGHENILGFHNEDGSKLRPQFSNVDDMNEYMVEAWNKVVSDSDIVYHLGDVYFAKGWQHLYRLKGRKRLILGNHDNAKCQHLQKVFQKILVWRVFREHNAVLTHVPIHKDSFCRAKYNLHGHVHCNSLPDKDYINCSVEVINFVPTPLEVMVKNADVAQR